MINNILLTILLFLVIVYINRESINKRLIENFNPNVDGGNTSLDVGDMVYFKTDVVPIPDDMNLCATDDKTSKNLIVEGQICSMNATRDKALLKYTSIINPNINDKCKDKFSYNDIRSVPVISRTVDGLNNNVSQGDQTKYLGGIKMDGSPQCGIEGSAYKRKTRWEACKKSDECGPGLFCREGDNRCMDDADCAKTNWDNRTMNSCVAMPKTITENSFPTEIPVIKLSRNMPFELRGNESKRRLSVDNQLLNAYYTYDHVANNVEGVNKKIESDLERNITNYADNLTSSFSDKKNMALALSDMTTQHGNEIIPKANNQLSRQEADKYFKSKAIEGIINESASTIDQIISQNTQNISSELPNILDRQFKTQMSEGVNALSENATNVELIEKIYDGIMKKQKAEFNNSAIVPIMSGVDKTIKDAMAYKKLKLPKQDLSNYRGVLVRTYNSNNVLVAGSNYGTFLDEKIVPSINYFMTTTFDSFFTGSKLSNYRYLEFFGNMNFPNLAETVEFNIVAGSGIRFYFGGELQIDEYSNSTKVDHYSRLNYIQPNSTIPYKIIAYEGDNNTNSHLILKWRINRMGNFNVIPAANYFLPNLKYD